MYKLRAGIASFATVLILSQGVAQAKNYCLSGFPNTAYIVVGLGFTVPAKGKCKPFNGFNAQGNFPAAGIGCTSSTGSNLSLTLTTGFEVSERVDIINFSLSLPSQTGDAVIQEIGGNAVTSLTSSGIVGAACSTKTIPAVTEPGAASTRAGDGSAP